MLLNNCISLRFFFIGRAIPGGNILHWCQSPFQVITESLRAADLILLFFIRVRPGIMIDEPGDLFPCRPTRPWISGQEYPGRYHVVFPYPSFLSGKTLKSGNFLPLHFFCIVLRLRATQGTGISHELLFLVYVVCVPYPLNHSFAYHAFPGCGFVSFTCH